MAEFLLWLGGLLLIGDAAYRMSSRGPVELRNGKILSGNAKLIRVLSCLGIGSIVIAVSGWISAMIGLGLPPAEPVVNLLTKEEMSGADMFTSGVVVMVGCFAISLLYPLVVFVAKYFLRHLELTLELKMIGLTATWIVAMVGWGVWATLDGLLEVRWDFWGKLKPVSVVAVFMFPFAGQLLFRLIGNSESDGLDDQEEELWDCRIGKITLRELPLQKLVALASVSVLESNHQVKPSSDDEWQPVSSVDEIASASENSLDSMFRFECRHCEHGKGMRIPLSAMTGGVECPRCRKSVSADGLVKRQLVHQFGDRNGQKLFAMFQEMGVVAESRPRKATERAFALQCGQCGKKLRLKRRPDVPCVKCPQCDQDIPVPRKKRN